MSKAIHFRNAERVLARKRHERAKEWEIRKRVRSIKNEARVNWDPPIDLLALADHMGISKERIRHVPLAIDGRLIEEHGELWIEINDRLQGFDVQYTIAHELGHLVVEGERARCTHLPGVRRSEWGYRSLEELCDRAADEILLPADWVHEKTSSTKPSLRFAKEIAEVADCGFHFALTFILRRRIWDAWALWWKRVGDNDCMTYASFPAKDEGSLVSIELVSRHTSSPLSRCIEGEDFAEGSLTLSFDGEEHTYNASCMTLGEKKAISLLLLAMNEVD